MWVNYSSETEQKGLLYEEVTTDFAAERCRWNDVPVPKPTPGSCATTSRETPGTVSPASARAILRAHVAS